MRVKHDSNLKSIMSILLVLCSGCLFSQTKGINPIAKNEVKIIGTTRAVIVGISDYQNKNITDLQFADKDAKLFGDYLMSREGGNVDSNNITILLNEKATAGQFVSALYSLIELSQEGDQVIIYFSGHGDVESVTINQPGFLLCWDSPAKVYMSGGTFGLVYLQEIISTLAIQNKAKVIMITDACRAGKLAGSEIGGSQATAVNLSKQFANETKILSCQPNEYALEGMNWGGGRGVFSYYFLNGIQGLADKNNDGEVTLTEIGRYLEDNITESVAPHPQTPMILGERTTKISKVNSEVLAMLLKENHKEEFSSIVTRSNINSELITKDTTLLKKYKAFNKAINNKHLLYPEVGSAWSIFQEIKNAVGLEKHVGLMKRNLAAALQDDAQQAINDYLAADSKELYNRWKFNIKYKTYPEALNKAAELLGSSHFFYNTLRSRAFYFEGLNLRLEGEKLSQTEKYIQSISLQDSSLYYDSTSAFALNEKGYSLYLLNKFDESIIYYDKALKLSPTWALAWANKAAAYNDLHDYVKAMDAGQTALMIDSTLITAINNVAVSFYWMNEYQSAKSIIDYGKNIDSTYVNFYTILGLIAWKQNDLIEAEKQMLKSYLLDSTVVSTCTSLAHFYLKLNNNESAKRYFLKAKDINPKSEQAIQGMIEYYFYTNDFDNAGKELEAYVKQYPDDNFAYYLIASISAKQDNEEKCLSFLEQAFIKGFKQWEVLVADENFGFVKLNDSYKKLVSKYNKEYKD